MEINSTNGLNAYTNVPRTPPQAENTQPRQDTVEATGTEVESQDAATQAFEVTITQEAQDRLAEDRAEESAQAQETAQQQNPSSSADTAPQDTSQVVNIVA